MNNLQKLSRKGKHTVFRGRQLPEGIIWKEETEEEIEQRKLLFPDYRPYKGGGHWMAYDQYPNPKVLLYEGTDYSRAIAAREQYMNNHNSQ